MTSLRWQRLIPTLVAIIDHYALWPGFRIAAFILTLLVVAVELCFRKIEGTKTTNPNRTISNHLTVTWISVSCRTPSRAGALQSPRWPSPGKSPVQNLTPLPR